MKVVALAAQKGGVGKSTLAIHLAVMTGAVLVDTDPQRSAGEWWRARSADTPILVETDAAGLGAVMKAAKADGAELVIIDTAPHAEESIAAVARVSDFIVIPCRPSILDLRAIGATVDLVKKQRKPAGIVLNAAPAGRGFGEASIVREARAGLEVYGLPVCPVAVTARAALQHALIDGRAVTEFEPHGRAAGELRDLWRWIEGQL